jgi:hypothetical protein
MNVPPGGARLAEPPYRWMSLQARILFPGAMPAQVRFIANIETLQTASSNIFSRFEKKT